MTTIETEGVSFTKRDKYGRTRITINGRKFGHIRENKNRSYSWRAKVGKEWTTIKFANKTEVISAIKKVRDDGIKSITPETKHETKTETEPTPKPKTIKQIKTPKIDFIENNKEISLMVYGIDKQKNVLLKGPTGCGKSYLIEQLAKHYGKKLYTVNCDVELDKTELVGHHEIENDETTWIDGILVSAMKEGAWIVFDEVNMARPEVLSVMHQILDYRRTLTVKEHHNEEVKAKDGFCVFATINPNYCGTTELNYAFRRRFNLILDMDYLPKHGENKLIQSRTKLSPDRSLKLVEIGNTTRTMQKDGKLTHAISTAHLLEFAEMLVANNHNPIECARTTLNVSDEFGEMEDILNVVKNYF